MGREARAFFESRLRGPEDARQAVLAALAGREPWRLARAAVDRGRELGVDPDAALRLGLLAETVAAALHTCDRAHRGHPLPTRLDRARRVLVADTLLTLCWELAADLPEAAFPQVAEALKAAAGGTGYLAELVGRPPETSGPAAAAKSPDSAAAVHSSDPDAAASAFLDRALPLLVRGQSTRSARDRS